MGFLKKAFKAVKKVVKKVAKGVKKLASGVVKAISKIPIVGKVVDLIGKLGPIGSLAMSFVLPGVGSMLSGFWQTAASSLAGSGNAIFQAVGKGMQFLAKAGSTVTGAIKGGFKSITDTIGGVLKQVGGNISDGFTNLWNSAKDTVSNMFGGTKGVPSDIGQAVADNATNAYKASFNQAAVDPLSKNIVESNLSDLAKNTGFNLDKAVAKGAAEQFGATPLTDPLTRNIMSGQTSTGMDALSSNIQESWMKKNMPYTQVAKEEGFMPGMQDLGLDPSSKNFSTLADRTIDAAQRAHDNSGGLLSNIMEFAKDALGGGMAGMELPYVPSSTGDVGAAMASGRMGVSGRGASGGQFLTDAQLQQQQYMAQQLGQAG